MNNNAPLRGVKVLDLTRLLPGPVCTLHLADLGADVIKIEDTGAGDYAAPAVRALVNRNKRGIRLDLKQPEGVELFMRLAAAADVIVEGFRPGVVQRLGIDYAAVARVNPRIVYCSISGYGQTGPLRDVAGHDLNYCGYAGVADQIGTVDASGVHSPALSNVPIADLMGGSLTAAMGILAAIFDAARSGTGRHVDVSISDGVLAHAVLPLATLTAHGSTRPAGGDTLTGALACYSLYATADGRYLAVGALEKKFWDAFCAVIERPDLKPLHRSADPAVTARVRAELTALIGAHTLAWWQDKLRGTDCCVSPVHKLEEALQNEHFRARGMVIETTHPTYGRVTHVASPVKMTGYEFKIERQAPLPGEHTEQVLREIGVTEQAIASLKEHGIAAARA
ncbi:MAG TPA: CaiB/BaiF CoA-transferase family protein [Burkholderiaceae bacterium]|nr:CaiB/BaiF CoA-transferase family protein [Burkholderiaceae bacterium]